jgi:hypothetical protein
MLQNRVDPFGNIIVTSARGSLMGNRGVIHKDKEIVKAFNHKAWIICSLEFKGRKRTVMMPDRWTELFFLDEATAFAAGHRPCFECRREDAMRFKSSWIQGNPQYGFHMKTSIQLIDSIIHAERIDSNNKKITHQRLLSDIPAGTFVLSNDEPFIFHKNQLHRWSPFGYEEGIMMDANSLLTVLTPRSVVNAFRAGYVPLIGQVVSRSADH